MQPMISASTGKLISLRVANIWTWRRRRPPASAGVHCGQGSGSMCIPACRMW